MEAYSRCTYLFGIFFFFQNKRTKHRCIRADGRFTDAAARDEKFYNVERKEKRPELQHLISIKMSHNITIYSDVSLERLPKT